ncbi:MAG: hypothetical protein Kow00121_54830 [Elainellaceae cyanobacterium]
MNSHAVNHTIITSLVIGTVDFLPRNSYFADWARGEPAYDRRSACLILGKQNNIGNKRHIFSVELALKCFSVA